MLGRSAENAKGRHDHKDLGRPVAPKQLQFIMNGCAFKDGLATMPCKLNAVQWLSLQIYIALSICSHASKQLQGPGLVQDPGMAVV